MASYSLSVIADKVIDIHLSVIIWFDNAFDSDTYSNYINVLTKLSNRESNICCTSHGHAIVVDESHTTSSLREREHCVKCRAIVASALHSIARE